MQEIYYSRKCDFDTFIAFLSIIFFEKSLELDKMSIWK